MQLVELPLDWCRLGLRKRGRGRDDLHDLKPSQLKFRENSGKRFDGPLMNVVKNQDTSTLGLYLGDRALCDLCAAYPFPVIGSDVSAPGHETARRQRGLGSRRSQEPGNSKKRSDLISVAKSGGDGIDSFINLCSGVRFSARLFIPPGSDPASGSVSPKQPTHSPLASFGRYFLRCASSPYA